MNMKWYILYIVNSAHVSRLQAVLTNIYLVKHLSNYVRLGTGLEKTKVILKKKFLTCFFGDFIEFFVYSSYVYVNQFKQAFKK